MTDPVSAIRALPRFTYLSREDAREGLVAAVRAVDVERLARGLYQRQHRTIHQDGYDALSEYQRQEFALQARAAIDALVAEIEGNT